MQGGDLDRRVQFLRPKAEARSATGGSVDGYEPAFKLWAKVHYLRGGEAVFASRMQGRRPAVLTLRASSNTGQIGGRWVVEFDDLQFEVRELPKPIAKSGFVEMLVEAKT